MTIVFFIESRLKDNGAEHQKYISNNCVDIIRCFSHTHTHKKTYGSEYNYGRLFNRFINLHINEDIATDMQTDMKHK